MPECCLSLPESGFYVYDDVCTFGKVYILFLVAGNGARRGEKGKPFVAPDVNPAHTHITLIRGFMSSVVPRGLAKGIKIDENIQGSIEVHFQLIKKI